MKPERDPILCSSCDELAAISTPAGPMCREHADDLAGELGGCR